MRRSNPDYPYFLSGGYRARFADAYPATPSSEIAEIRRADGTHAGDRSWELLCQQFFERLPAEQAET